MKCTQCQNEHDLDEGFVRIEIWDKFTRGCPCGHNHARTYSALEFCSISCLEKYVLEKKLSIKPKAPERNNDLRELRDQF